MPLNLMCGRDLRVSQVLKFTREGESLALIKLMPQCLTLWTSRVWHGPSALLLLHVRKGTAGERLVVFVQAPNVCSRLAT